ncbi:MAG: sel1 repeat family protein, partial [Bacteroidaceae bacterium]|nr:sel1 repeat family protein [Bacteroidaceae bacterium]
PLAERLFFVRHDSLQAGDRQTVKLRVTANGDAPHKLKLQPHERVTLTVEREDGKPLNANSNYAVAVVDQAGVQTTSWGYNLYTYQLLGSELKGYIPDAWQYFDPENKERDRHLDLIMLTHGWTAYDWSKLTATDMSRVVPAEKGLTLRGQYYRRYKNNKFGKKGCVSIALNRYSPIMLYVPKDTLVAAYPFRTDSIGHFAVDIEDFYGRKVIALSPSNPNRKSKNSWDAFLLDRYFSPSPRLLSYWERNIGSSFIQDEVLDSVKKTTPFEYQLSTLNVKDKKGDSRFLRKPISELRLDYMEEWEYAMDITYRYGIYDFTRYYDTEEYRYFFTTFLFDYADGTYRQLLYDKNDKNHYGNLSASAGEAYSGGSSGASIQWSDFYGYYNFRDNLPQYRNTITVSNVIQSIFARYNLHWCYWVMPAVIEGEYNNDSLPVIDEDYLHGRDVWKMTNFSEIILSSARKHCEIFSGGLEFWSPKAQLGLMEYVGNTSPDESVQLGPFWNKVPYSFLFDGFYTMKTIYPTGNEISVESNFFWERLKSNGVQSLSPDYLKESVPNPNYVAFLVKAENDTTNTQLKVDLTNEAGSRRYTSFRGYSHSKQFYSPDYSRMRPDGKDYRRTLLWNPQATSVDGKLQFELYNSSECGAIAIDVTGVDGGVFYSNDEYLSTRVDEALRNSSNEKVSEDISLKPAVADSIIVFSAADSLVLQRVFEKAEAYLNKKIYSKSINIYAELIQYGYIPAYYRVGYSYRYGLGIMKSAPHALTFFVHAAERGHADAQYEYAMMLLNGEGTEASPETAVLWLEKAAEQEHVDAQNELAKCYLYGNGAPFDLAVADSLLRKASIAGHPEALYLYAMRMQRLEIRNDNILGSVIDCVSRSADKGNADALDYMIQYCRSIGDDENMYRNALKLHQQGDKRGTKALADCYLNGQGVKRDKSLAKDLYREAGE